MYTGICGRLQNVSPHPNADRLQVATIANCQVIVGLDAKNGDLGVFFPADGQLDAEFAKANKLTKEEGGYLDSTCRIRAIKLRGVKSEGIFLSEFAFTNYLIREGERVGEPLCKRYETPATRKAREAGMKVARKANSHFAKHADTDQFRTNGEFIPVGSLITITEKLHGTSGRYGYVQKDSVRPRWWERIAEKFGLSRQPEYEFLVGTRNVVLSREGAKTYYGSEEFRTTVVTGTYGSLERNLRKGECVYGEIVGWTTEGQPIMEPHKGVPYAYSQTKGTAKFYVYNITITDEGGKVWTLPYRAMVARAKELGFDTPPLFDQFVYTAGDFRSLADTVAHYVEGNSTLDATHIREGVVIRVDTPSGHTYWLKEKSFDFKVAEGIIKDKDIVDREEAS